MFYFTDVSKIETRELCLMYIPKEASVSLGGCVSPFLSQPFTLNMSQGANCLLCIIRILGGHLTMEAMFRKPLGCRLLCFNWLSCICYKESVYVIF